MVYLLYGIFSLYVHKRKLNYFISMNYLMVLNYKNIQNTSRETKSLGG